MEVGMLWLDSERQVDLSVRIGRAVAYYREKYGRRPNLCIIHPVTAGEDPLNQIDELSVRSSVSVLPDHFWIGVEERELSARMEVRVAA
jgi:hypothetical protein